jgi:hypothetical protein
MMEVRVMVSEGEPGEPALDFRGERSAKCTSAVIPHKQANQIT